MIKIILQIVATLVGKIGAKDQSKRDERKARVVAVAENMQRSGTDEGISLIWFFPLVMLWISPERAIAYINQLESLPEWYVQMLVGITIAVFGLGKLNRNK